jgi:CubicO group peptidase (beta-lactamase class C family)
VAELKGEWSLQFAPLADAFAANFDAGQEIGAAICVYQRGKKVVDIWAGLKDKSIDDPWREDSLVPVFSVTKALAALCFLILANRKKFDYDRPVAHYWPDFALAGKGEITCRQLLEHRAGLYAIEKPLQLSDFADNYPRVYNALILQRPLFIPGSNQGYGAQVWGAYAGELFRQVAGESIGQFLRARSRKNLASMRTLASRPQMTIRSQRFIPFRYLTVSQRSCPT